ncbi:hypothetical protein ACR6HW_07165 [Fusibacter sp. JL298sf-3]
MKKTKNIFTLFLGTLIALSFSVSAFASDIKAEPTLTVKDYTEFLAKESPEDFQKFKALSTSEQEKYLDYLLNPATYSGNLNTSDVTASSIDELDESSSPTNTTTRNAWGSRTVTILGIKVLEYRIEVGYDVTGSSIEKINYYDAYVVKNLNPLVQTDTTSKSAYISNNVVHAKGVFYYKVGPLKGLSVQIGNVYGELLAYPSGESSISYWGDKL